ncbi:biogenesis of lysosome-related organelles complex 1 subunit 2-like [Vespula squamosa]|uniref:Biogenesis of lysosome-related organelles complex 1 subunit 2-like n=1 Tax=Vespula squamosa TaxID=30214 RepID=A0ABD2BH97_VESSQ
MFSYNTSVHEDRQYTPSKIVFGRLVRTPNDPSGNNLRNETSTQFEPDKRKIKILLRKEAKPNNVQTRRKRIPSKGLKKKGNLKPMQRSPNGKYSR